ncbi:hypothetical protein M422DRAFT_194251, partial [Sphaerobolus stellatus SS14]
MELWSSDIQGLANQVAAARSSFTWEQNSIFNEFVDAIHWQKSLSVFIDGKAGQGKTFLIQSIMNYTRSLGKIALVTATSAFAALLYSGGRTTHSAFKVSLNSSRAKFLREVSVIFWDEAPMANRAVLESIDDLLRKICETDLPFGGKIFACAGDFRQTCPVIRRGSKWQVIDASIKSSPLWNSFQIRRLTVPIRNA